MKELTIRLDDQTFVDLWAMARRYGITMEEAARRCIKYVLTEVENPEADPANDPAVRKLLSWIIPVMRGEEGE